MDTSLITLGLLSVASHQQKKAGETGMVRCLQDK